MESRHHGLADMGGGLMVQRPPRFLVVVRDLEVPENGRRGHPRYLSASDTRPAPMNPDARGPTNGAWERPSPSGWSACASFASTPSPGPRRSLPAPCTSA